MMDQRIVTLRLPVIQGLLQRIQNKVGLHGTALAPTHDPASVNVERVGHVLPALPG